MEPTQDELKAIKEEEEELESVLESLTEQLHRGEDRFRIEEQRARTLTAEIVASRRNEDKAALASDEALSHKMRDIKKEELTDIDKLLDSPYFAKVKIKEEINGQIKTISYKLGLRSNIDTRIIDWRRAPIAKLYYEYQEGDEYFEIIQGKEREGEILARVKIRIENSKLLEITNSFGTFSNTGGKWQKSKARGKSEAGRMPDVLSLITKEQFKSITEDAENAVLIQGVAGSGKTTVALHRLAWLMHGENSDFNSSDVLVVLRSPLLRSYIESSLKHLNIEGVPVLTWAKWRNQVLASILKTNPKEVKRPKKNCSFSVKRIKNSLALLTALETYVSKQNKHIVKQLKDILKLQHLGASVSTMLEEQEILEEPIIIFLRKLYSVIKNSKNESVGYPEAFDEALETINKIAPQLKNYQQDINAILSQSNFILEHDETKLLDKDIIEEALAWSNYCLENKVIDKSDDALIIRLHQLKSGEFLNHNGSNKKYKHIVIDELQDFRAIELAPLVSSAYQKENLTLAGDTSQDIREENSFSGWQKLIQLWKLETSSTKYMELEVSHRSTLEIMQFANKITNNNQTIKGRRGKAPLWYKCSSEESGVSKALSWLEKAIELQPDGITAVLCANQNQAKFAHSMLEPSFGPILRIWEYSNFSFEEGIVVTQVPTVKGLEFKSVLIWNPSQAVYPNNNRSRNMLYVAATRAEDNLAVVSWDNQSSALPGFYSKYVRGIEEAEE